MSGAGPSREAPGAATGAPPVTTPSGLLAHPSTPRSLRVHDAAVRAATELLDAGGLPAATMDAVVARSGVSKATLYKHWPSRTALAAEAFGLRTADTRPLPGAGSARGDLTEQIRRFGALCAGRHGPVLAQLLAACATDPGAGAYLRAFFLKARRDAIAELWLRAVRRGDADPDIDAATATDLLLGPPILRLLTGRPPPTPEEADRLCAAALDGLLPRATS